MRHLPARLQSVRTLFEKSVLSWQLLGAGIVVLVVVAAGWLLSPGVQEVRLGNVMARSAALGYVGEKPLRGCILGIGMAFPPDVVWKCAEKTKAIQLVALERLQEEMRYRFVLVSGLRVVIRPIPIFRTTSVQMEQLRAPVPGYGTVVDLTGNRVPDALVYVYSQTSRSVAQHPVVALTNDQGNYALDLANLRPFGSSFMTLAYASQGRVVQQESDIRVVSPFPSLWFPAEEPEISWWQVWREWL